MANLTNPAFCGKVLHNCFKAYKEGSNQNFPFALSFFILPFILHKQSRNLLLDRTKKTLHTWLDENNQLKVGVVERIKSYVPFTRESIMFLTAFNAISINEQGEVEIKPLKNSTSVLEDEEVQDCLKKAQVFGKMLSRSGNIFTIYSIIGVKP